MLLTPVTIDLSNIGAILHLNGHLKEAEESYLAGLQLDPLNKIARENLSKLRNLMQRQREENRIGWMSELVSNTINALHADT